MRRRASKWEGLRWATALPALLATVAGHGADVQGSLGVSSDNVFRGVSLSDEQPALLADLHASDTRWFGGVAADTVRLPPYESSQAQVIGYLGYQRMLAQSWSGVLSVRRYDYLGHVYRARYDYDELGATLSYRDRLSFQLIGSPDTYEAADAYHYGRGAAYAFELSARQPLPYGLTAEPGIGYYELRRQVGAGYAYWNIALSKQLDGWAFTLGYIGTDATARRLFGSLAGQRVVASAVWSF